VLRGRCCCCWGLQLPWLNCLTSSRSCVVLVCRQALCCFHLSKLVIPGSSSSCACEPQAASETSSRLGAFWLDAAATGAAAAAARLLVLAALQAAPGCWQQQGCSTSRWWSWLPPCWSTSPRVDAAALEPPSHYKGTHVVFTSPALRPTSYCPSICWWLEGHSGELSSSMLGRPCCLWPVLIVS